MKNMKVFISRPDMRVRMMFSEQAGYSVIEDPNEADMMVFTGGADVNPRLYNEKLLHGTLIDDRADRTDVENLAIASSKKIPTIGICRGAQFLNVMSGGALWQDVNGHTCGVHEVIDLGINEGSKLEVTSTHHQMMIPSNSGVELCIAKITSEFISNKARNKPKHDTEVVFYESNKSLCFQPHPEYGHKATRLYFFDLIDHYIL